MSYRSFHVIPDAADLERVRRSYDPPTDIVPALIVADHVVLQFGTDDPQFAIEYLTKLASEASALAQTIAVVTS